VFALPLQHWTVGGHGGESAEAKPSRRGPRQSKAIMLRVSELRLPLDHEEVDLVSALCRVLKVARTDILRWTIDRRGYDARKRAAIKLVYTIDVEIRNEQGVLRQADPQRIRPTPDTAYQFVAKAPRGYILRPVVIGCGPCGLFAALTLAQMGFRPIVIERGKAVRERTRDTWCLWRQGVFNPDSNAQFGEGGAGTFSDGKLYSGVKDPGHIKRKVLTELVAAGAPGEILYVSKPHVGTFRLVTVVENMRQTILELGGEYRFETKMVDLEIQVTHGTRCLAGLILANGERIAADHVVLAMGHSARDTFDTMVRCGVAMEKKPFSIGVRIEHPQSLIDRARFGGNAGQPLLGAADYKLVYHGSGGRSVYSFCMCPGGRVVAATSEPGCVVTNGMSQYSRAEFNANAGIVVGVAPHDFPGDVLAGVEFQRRWERRAFAAGGGTYAAPAQRVADFLAGRASMVIGTILPSYRPGVVPADLAACLPDFAVAAIREALPAFARQIPGFADDDVIMTGVETRTSSPVRLARDATYQSPSVRGLFPAGEGAGYAGGIMSAAIDGIRVAEAVALAVTGGEMRLGAPHEAARVVYG
jgi:uncharacterized FAD-dependent dehydrogenase